MQAAVASLKIEDTLDDDMTMNINRLSSNNANIRIIVLCAQPSTRKYIDIYCQTIDKNILCLKKLIVSALFVEA